MHKRIAITGGIGSGKSLVLSYLQERGYPAFSCDDIYKDVIQTSEYIREINSIFPSVVVDGKIDRTKLSKIVFNNKDALQKLNSIAHPLIMKELYKRMEAASKDYSLIFAEVPLLFENHFEKDFDEIVVILRDNEERIAAVKGRDHLSENEISKKMQAQFDYDSNAQLLSCTPNVYLIKNDSDQDTLKNKIDNMIQAMLLT